MQSSSCFGHLLSKRPKHGEDFFQILCVSQKVQTLAGSPSTAAKAQGPRANIANIAEYMAKVPNSMAKRLVVDQTLPHSRHSLLMLFLTCQNPRQRMKDCV